MSSDPQELDKNALDETRLLMCCMCGGLVQDPLLLDCLHSCCRRCADEAAAKNGSNAVYCNNCEQATDVTTKNENIFIAGQAYHHSIIRDAHRCAICSASDKEVEASVWCRQCQTSLCAECLQGHDKYNKSHVTVLLEELKSMKSSSFIVSPRTCHRHGRAFELMCSNCETAECVECGESCISSRHDVQLLKGPKVDAQIAKLKSEVCRMHEVLNGKAKVIEACKMLTEELKTARELDQQKLAARKKVIDDSADKARVEADRALAGCYDKLDAKAFELRSRVERLERRLLHGIEYSDYLVNSGDVAGLIHQQKLLLAGLKSLEKALDDTKPPLSVTELVGVVGCPPESLDRLTCSWMGTTTLLTDDLCIGGSRVQQPNESLESVDCLQPRRATPAPKGRGSIGSQAAPLGVASSSFQSPVACWDMAVTSAGSLLLAVVQHGLREHDVRGAELSRWTPERRRWHGGEEWVTRVGALDDGRAAASVFHSQYVALLVRCQPAAAAGGAQWAERQRITLPLAPPHRLAVHAGLVAWSECRRPTDGDRRKWVPGPQFALVRLRADGEQRELLREQLAYDIFAIAVTAHAVVTSSCRATQTAADGSAHWLVDGYGHSGLRLWRQQWGEGVNDICPAAPTSRLLYLALPASATVTAVSSDDGRRLADVLSGSSDGLKAPLRLCVRESAAAAGDDASSMIAVLSNDCKTVAVYPAWGQA